MFTLRMAYHSALSIICSTVLYPCTMICVLMTTEFAVYVRMCPRDIITLGTTWRLIQISGSSQTTQTTLPMSRGLSLPTFVDDRIRFIIEWRIQMTKRIAPEVPQEVRHISKGICLGTTARGTRSCPSASTFSSHRTCNPSGSLSTVEEKNDETLLLC
jgi:hypothetical protein